MVAITIVVGGRQHATVAVGWVAVLGLDRVAVIRTTAAHVHPSDDFMLRHQPSQRTQRFCEVRVVLILAVRKQRDAIDVPQKPIGRRQMLGRKPFHLLRVERHEQLEVRSCRRRGVVNLAMRVNKLALQHRIGLINAADKAKTSSGRCACL